VTAARPAHVAFAAKILGDRGRFVASHTFDVQITASDPSATGATASLNDAFGQAVTQLSEWTRRLFERMIIVVCAYSPRATLCLEDVPFATDTAIDEGLQDVLLDVVIIVGDGRERLAWRREILNRVVDAVILHVVAAGSARDR